MRNIGAWLIIVFGAFLTFGGGGENGITVGITQCGTLAFVSCATGNLQIVKTIDGAAPQANWTVTVASSNCAAALTGRQDLVKSIPPGGGTATVLGLEVYVNTFGTNCLYTLTETPVSAWTPTFTPSGPYTLVANQTVSVALLNTADPTTTTTTAAPTTTTTIAATTTTAAQATTTVAATTTTPTTLAPTTTANGSGAGAPATVALPATGSSSSSTQTVIGVGLMIVGASLLVLRRRSERTEPTVS